LSLRASLYSRRRGNLTKSNVSNITMAIFNEIKLYVRLLRRLDYQAPRNDRNIGLTKILSQLILVNMKITARQIKSIITIIINGIIAIDFRAA
jgi:hypothetical protein